MKVRISLAGGDQAAELESLSDWLRGEPELAGRIGMAGANPRVGELGTLSDALVVAVGAGGTLSVLASSLAAWLSQPRRSGVHIRVQGETGRVVEVDADGVSGERVEALVREVLGSAPSED